MKRLRSPPKTPSGEGEKFLADEYPESRPLKIHLSALRASQARILTRNLRAAGATVLFRDDDDSEVPPSVVVTDRVPENESPGVTYVPPRWAEEVLRRRRPVSPKRFSLAAAKARAAASLALARATNSPSDKSSTENSRDTVVPAVWQSGTASRAGPAERARWIAAMPEYAVERATYTECVLPSPNAGLARMLRDLARVRELAGDGVGGGAMQATAFRNAAAALSALPFAVTATEVARVRDVGSSAADAVREFLDMGECREAKLLKCDARVKALDELAGVYGVGFKTARKLFDAGVTSEQGLVEFAKKEEAKALMRGISIFDRPYDALTLAEATAFRNKVAAVLGDAGFRLRIVLCGGYRRCKSKGHDVDIVYCRREPPSSESQLEALQDEHDTSPLHRRIIAAISKQGLLESRLHEEHGGPDGRRGRSYGYNEPQHARPKRTMSHEVLHGVCKFGGKFFRADFVGVRDAAEMPYATLAWSGSVVFQRSLRRWCVARRGLVFSGHGLFDARTGNRAEVGVNATTEHDVFAAMGLKYRPPFERAA